VDDIGLRFIAVDRPQAQQREVSLPGLWRSHLAADGVARAQVEALDLRGRHVDVVGTSQVIPVLRAQEPVPLGQDLENSLRLERGRPIEQTLLDAKDKVLLPQP
jgi:hypothetical protein